MLGTLFLFNGSSMLGVGSRPCEELGGLYDITDAFNYVLMSVGVVGNILSIVVFRSTSMKVCPHSPFMVGLNVSDIAYLLFHTFFTVILYRTGMVEVGSPNQLAETFRCYAETSVGTISLHYVVLFTIQRFLMIRFPRSSITRKMLVYNSSIALFVPVAVSFLYLPLVVLKESNSILLRVSFVVILRAVPGLLLVVLNLIIVWTLKKRTINMRNSIASEEECYQRVNVMLLTISFTFIVLNVPFAAIYAYVEMNGYEMPCRSHGFVVDVPLNVTYMICCLIFDCNFAINFFLYCLSARNFREALLSSWKERWDNLLTKTRKVSNISLPYHKRESEIETIGH